MGMIKQKIFMMMLGEQAVIGFVASLIGLIGSQLIADLMFQQQFGVPYLPNWREWLSVIFGITLTFAIMCLLMAKHRLKQPIHVFQQL